jgi:hypothetical protein
MGTRHTTSSRCGEALRMADYAATVRLIDDLVAAKRNHGQKTAS